MISFINCNCNEENQEERCVERHRSYPDTGFLPYPGRSPRHAGQRRVTILGNKVDDDGPAIPRQA